MPVFISASHPHILYSVFVLQIHIGVDVIQLDWKPMSEENIKDALEVVLNAAAHPLLIVSRFVIWPSWVSQE